MASVPTACIAEPSNSLHFSLASDNSSFVRDRELSSFSICAWRSEAQEIVVVLAPIQRFEVKVETLHV